MYRLEKRLERLPTSDGGGRGLNCHILGHPENSMLPSPPDGLSFVLGKYAEEGGHASMHAIPLASCERGIYTLLGLLPSFLSGGGSVFGSLCMPGDYIGRCDFGFLGLFCRCCTVTSKQRHPSSKAHIARTRPVLLSPN